MHETQLCKRNIVNWLQTHLPFLDLHHNRTNILIPRAMLLQCQRFRRTLSFLGAFICTPVLELAFVRVRWLRASARSMSVRICRPFGSIYIVVCVFDRVRSLWLYDPYLYLWSIIWFMISRVRTNTNKHEFRNSTSWNWLRLSLMNQIT